MDKPLVSLCITCYNQARFIREAVQSAFDQTYDPLEIVICDDHSTDGTDKIVEEMVADYQAKDGRHTVIFKRKEINLNVLKNYERAFRSGRGALIVTGSGDDISLPERVDKIVSAWIADGRSATVIHHGCERLDASGRSLGFDKARRPDIPLGACSAYRQDVFSAFPSPTRTSAYEDMIFGERAYMLGNALCIDDALIKYRIGGTTSNAFFDRRKLRNALQRERESYRQLDEDYKFADGKIDAGRIEMVRSANRTREAEMETRSPFVFADSIRERYRALKKMNGKIDWFGYGLFSQTIFILPDVISSPVARVHVAYCSVYSRFCWWAANHGFHPKRFVRKIFGYTASTKAGC